MPRRAVGIHVFAGGFSHGVNQVMDVQCQLETHGFGQATCEGSFGIPFLNHESWDKWPDVQADMAFGNPRCTGFSCITSGYDKTAHGPWSKPTKDIWDLSYYCVKQDYPIIVWESVQQAFSTGRPLLNKLRDDVYVPAGYRLAHILLNAGSFGNAQQRRRYFFVAYKRDVGNFNIEPPKISPYQTTVMDVLGAPGEKDVDWRFENLHSTADWDANCCQNLTPEEKYTMHYLPNGWDVNHLGRYATELLPRKFQETWWCRASDMPFSMHCIGRMNWHRPFPTIHSSTGRRIHPHWQRPVTVGEVAKIMGWGDKLPVGKDPIPQIAKGVVPAAGTWLAKQAEYFLNGAWGDDDYASVYDHHTGQWIGDECHGADEKVFNLTHYVGHQHHDDYPVPYGFQRYRLDVARGSRKLPRVRIFDPLEKWSDEGGTFVSVDPAEYGLEPIN